MVKTIESSNLLDNNDILNSKQNSDDDSNVKDKQIKSQNGGTTSTFDSSLQSSSSTSSPPSNPSGHLTVEKYILQLQQKDERIRTLKDENKRLRSTLLSKTSEFQIRVDELVTGLERQADIVKKLQNELAIYKRSNASFNDIAVKEPQNKKFNVSTPCFTSQNASITPTNIKTCSFNSSDVCAKLQKFVEKNNNNFGEIGTQQYIEAKKKRTTIKPTTFASSNVQKQQQCFESPGLIFCFNLNSDLILIYFFQLIKILA
jgi:hypothetical protein